MGDQGSGIDDTLCAEKVVHSMCVGGGRVNDGSQDPPLRSELNIEVTWTVSTSERKSKSINRLETLSVRAHREKTYPLPSYVMSQKRAKLLRRKGADRKTVNCSKYENCNLSKLRLVTRNQLVEILRLLSTKKSKSKESFKYEVDQFFDSGRMGSNEYKSMGLRYYIKNLSLMHSVRVNVDAVPVSLYHEDKTGRCLYQIWSASDYLTYVKGARIINPSQTHLSSEQYDVIKRLIPMQQTPVAGGINTVLMSLNKVTDLEEHLPDKSHTLDDLIWLGMHHEMFSPLNMEEMHRLLSSFPEKEISKFYEVNHGCIKVDHLVSPEGEHYYQPVKTRYAWSKTIVSVPIFDMNHEKGTCRVPVYRSCHVSRA